MDCGDLSPLWEQREFSRCRWRQIASGGKAPTSRRTPKAGSVKMRPHSARPEGLAVRKHREAKKRSCCFVFQRCVRPVFSHAECEHPLLFPALSRREIE